MKRFLQEVIRVGTAFVYGVMSTLLILLISMVGVAIAFFPILFALVIFVFFYIGSKEDAEQFCNKYLK